MPGLRKTRLAEIIRTIVSQSAEVRESEFIGPGGDLPGRCDLEWPTGIERQFIVYVWTIGHGGKSRSQQEYRIQTKLKLPRPLQFEGGITLLLGYYDASLDGAGR